MHYRTYGCRFLLHSLVSRVEVLATASFLTSPGMNRHSRRGRFECQFRKSKWVNIRSEFPREMLCRLICFLITNSGSWYSKWSPNMGKEEERRRTAFLWIYQVSQVNPELEDSTNKLYKQNLPFSNGVIIPCHSSEASVRWDARPRSNGSSSHEGLNKTRA